MEHLTKLLRDSYDLQESKPNESAYWHLQKLRSEIKQLILTDVLQKSEQFECDNGCNWYRVGHQLNGHQECRTCGKQKAF